jgi:hypothetical protein
MRANFRGIITAAFLGVWALSAWPGLVAAEERVSFKTDVQPILTKLGCNQGACHGAQHGKGGFKLSLRGFDDKADYQEIVRGALSRRVFLVDPGRSLLLLKPTVATPHEGGKRLVKGSWAYQTIVRWLSQGASGPDPKDHKLKSLVVTPAEAILQPGQHVQVVPKAVYEDGSEELPANKAGFDCTSPSIAEVNSEGVVTAKGKGETVVMVRYLGTVAVARIIVPHGPAAAFDQFVPNNYIDKLWGQKWRKIGLTPSPPCDDAEFFRRIHINTISTLPRPEDVKKFLADPSPSKREKAIDAVLDRPEYVDAWAYKWGDLLLNSRRTLQKKGMWSLHNWLRASFSANKPMDKFVAELITAVGSPYANGPANFYGIGQADEWTESTAQVFLGVRLQCAKCHNHPYENILQSDYYSMKAFFARVGKKSSQEFGLAGGDTVIFVGDSGEVGHARTGEIMKPKPIGGPFLDDPVDRRRALADWLVRRENPAYARNLANRYWGYFLGLGLVSPIDDLRVTNPASCPEVLDALALDLIEHHYDIKHLMRTIMRSRVYQSSSVATSKSRVDGDNRYFTHFQPRRLTAEQLLDAVDFACGTREKFNELPLGYRAIALPDSDYASEFLDAFGRPRRAVPCECERSEAPTMTQALLMVSGSLLNRKVIDANGRVSTMIKAKTPPEKAVEDLFLCTVSRPPTLKERDEALAEVKSAPSLKEGLEDLLWSLLNTREFEFNH